MNNYIVKTTDPIVLASIKELDERSVVGIKKYGTTLEENNTDDFFQHLKEELLDGVNYISKLQAQQEQVSAVDNEWSLDDIRGTYNCSDHEARVVLNAALEKDDVVEAVFQGIDYHAKKLGLTRK